MSEQDKVSNSLMAGELRKAARLYEVFKHASAGADLLANLEKEVQKFERQKTSLSKECLELDTACNIAVDKANQAEIIAKKALKSKEDIIKEAEGQASVIISKAKLEAKAIITSSEDVIQSKQTAIDNLKKEIHTLGIRKNEAERSYQLAEKELKDIKDKFLKAVS